MLAPWFEERRNQTDPTGGIPAEVLEYELLPRTARIRRGIDRAQDEGVLAHVCHGEASCGRGRAVSRWWSDKLWIICECLFSMALIQARVGPLSTLPSVRLLCCHIETPSLYHVSQHQTHTSIFVHNALDHQPTFPTSSPRTVDQLQVFAVIWIASCPAAKQRFPTQWCNSISWSPYLNLDMLGKNSWDAKALQSGNTTDVQLQAQLDLQGAAVAAAAVDDVQAVDPSSSLWIICAPGVITMAIWIYFVVGSAHVKHALGVQSRFVPTVERLVIRLGECAFTSRAYTATTTTVGRDEYVVCVFAAIGSCPRLFPEFLGACVHASDPRSHAGCAGILPWAVYTARHVTCQELDVLAGWQRKFTCETYDSSQITCRAV